jgi:hypothetical protein
MSGASELARSFIQEATSSLNISMEQKAKAQPQSSPRTLIRSRGSQQLHILLCANVSSIHYLAQQPYANASESFLPRRSLLLRSKTALWTTQLRHWSKKCIIGINVDPNLSTLRPQTSNAKALPNREGGQLPGHTQAGRPACCGHWRVPGSLDRLNRNSDRLASAFARGS